MSSNFLVILSLAACALAVTGIELRAGSGAALEKKVNSADDALTVLAHVPTIEQSLRICNAYASVKALDIWHVQTKRKLTTEPLAYRQCIDSEVALDEGDQLDFKAGDLDMGTFYATGLPRQHTSLLLISRRKSPGSSAMAFDSHAFADLQTAQVAVVDAYAGQHKATMQITNPGAVEDLEYNTVVSLNPGDYQLSLLGDQQNATKYAFPAAPARNYVAMRVGVEKNSADENFPMELIIFPNGAFTLRLNHLIGALLAMVLASRQ